MVHTNVSPGDIVVNGGLFSFEGSSSVPASLKPDNVTPYSINYNTGTTFQVFLQSAADNFNLSRQVNINGEVTIRNNATGARHNCQPN